MYLLATTCEAVAATTKKTEKIWMVADYLRSRSSQDAVISARFLSGRPFPASEERTLQVGGALLWKILGELSGADEAGMAAAYRRHGDLGSAAFDLLQTVAPKAGSLPLAQIHAVLVRIAEASGPAAKGRFLGELLARATALEAKYLVKIVTGELRIGLKESFVEEAIARAYGQALSDVQRANMLTGDIGETLTLAASGQLGAARMHLFHPIGFMLATPAADAEEAFAEFPQALVEDKYDGIRAQVHVSGEKVRIFSRTLDDITESFPELVPVLAEFGQEIILDGEILAWQDGHAMPFSQLQKRLGRKRVPAALLREVPVSYLAFDVLFAKGELLLDKPLRHRAAMLDALFQEAAPLLAAPRAFGQGILAFGDTEDSHEPRVLRAPQSAADSPDDLDRLFTAAQERGNEGLMIKNPESPYAVGRRGRSWLKLKRELATLDVVVTTVEFGHGKRAGVLSDYTFAVRHEDRLLNVGKAYSGLTDKEIAELTRWFMDHTLLDRGFQRDVEPAVVIEVAFNAVMRSDRHNSGYALRFPRIVRIRNDKPPQEIDTLQRVTEIYDSQFHRRKRA